MGKRVIAVLGIMVNTLIAQSDVDRLNLKYIYEGAKEIEMLDRAMDAGIREHNAKETPIYQESSKTLIDNSPIETFNNLGSKYLLEKSIPKGAKVQSRVEGRVLIIEITTTQKKRVVTKDGVGESSIKSTTTEEIPIPYDADISLLKKELRDGLFRVEVPKIKER